MSRFHCKKERALSLNRAFSELLCGASFQGWVVHFDFRSTYPKIVVFEQENATRREDKRIFPNEANKLIHVVSHNDTVHPLTICLHVGGGGAFLQNPSCD